MLFHQEGKANPRKVLLERVRAPLQIQRQGAGQ